MNGRRIPPVLWASLLTLSLSLTARAGDWAEFRGPGRDGVAEEESIFGSWPEEGPEELWRRPVGAGYSGVAAVGDRLFTMAATDRGEELLSLSRDSGET